MTEKELHKIFSENVKRFRIDVDWSQVALAKKAGVSINFINDIESGKKWASPTTMLKIANVFNIYVYELLKPAGIFPDNLNSIIKKYTDNMHTAIEDACGAFLKNANTAASPK
ncbi:MAG: helix-turn-helix domain-containing protein [Treponema sp.]|jgi:transcriptional regulator with XRE-family HTH domain|nr:helix-turn-helix domain-containing protein [Treponema sp.]